MRGPSFVQHAMARMGTTMRQEKLADKREYNFLCGRASGIQRPSEYSLQQLCEALGVTTSLTSLRLSGEFTRTDAEMLGAALQRNTTLQTLNVINCNDESLQLSTEIGNALAVNKPPLNTIKMWGGVVFIGTSVRCDPIIAAMRTNTTLTSLDIDREPIQNSQVLEALRSNTVLTSLALKSNTLFPSSIDALGNALRYNTALTSLEVDADRFDVPDFQRLQAALDDSSDEEEEDIPRTRRNRATATTPPSVTGSLQNFVNSLNSSLTRLKLSSGTVSSAAVSTLYHSIGTLMGKTSITDLDLSRNPIDTSQVVAMLGTNTHLERLNIGGCTCTDTIVPALQQALQTNTVLTDLAIGCLNNNAAAAVATALTPPRNNTSLTRLDLRSCTFGDAGAEALVAAVRSNQNIATVLLPEGRVSAAMIERMHTELGGRTTPIMGVSVKAAVAARPLKRRRT